MIIVIATLPIIILLVISLILCIGSSCEEKESKHVLYDREAHKEYHVYGTCIFYAKRCTNPYKSLYYRFDIGVFELANSYLVYIYEYSYGASMMEIDKLVTDPSEDAIRDGLVTRNRRLTRKGLVESILESDLIRRKAIPRETIFSIMRSKKFIEPAIEIKK